MLEDVGLDPMQLEIELEHLEDRRHGLEGIEVDPLPVLRQEKSEETDVGADIEHAGAVGELDAVFQVAAVLEDLAEEEVRLAAVQVEGQQAVGQLDAGMAIDTPLPLQAQHLAYWPGMPWV